MRLLIQSEDGQHEVMLDPTRTGFTIGRQDAGAGFEPDIDLSQHAPWRQWRNVSRQHARLFLQDGQWMIKDLGSVNYVFVNGRHIQNGTVYGLAQGDTISVGGIQIKVDLNE